MRGLCRPHLGKWLLTRCWGRWPSPFCCCLHKACPPGHPVASPLASTAGSLGGIWGSHVGEAPWWGVVLAGAPCDVSRGLGFAVFCVPLPDAGHHGHLWTSLGAAVPSTRIVPSHQALPTGCTTHASPVTRLCPWAAQPRPLAFTGPGEEGQGQVLSLPSPLLEWWLQ